MKIRTFFVIAGVLGLVASGRVRGQSSSLYLEDVEPPVVMVGPGGVMNTLSPALGAANFAAVRLPEPRRFAVHDLITIIVRESVESDAESEFNTDKKADLNGKISAFPNLQLKDLLNFKLTPSSMAGGDPEVDISLDKKFEGEGDFNRKDSFTARITARVIDIRPNGTLVLEARKYIKNDSETLNMVLTGTCRKEDVGADNTVLSTQIFDLRLVKEHTGELRRATKKGLLTKLFEGIFDF